jgi:hypothetical protein
MIMHKANSAWQDSKICEVLVKLKSLNRPVKLGEIVGALDTISDSLDMECNIDFCSTYGVYHIVPVNIEKPKK